jgi:hypothetical protein
MSAFGTKRTCRRDQPMSAFGGNAVVPECPLMTLSRRDNPLFAAQRKICGFAAWFVQRVTRFLVLCFSARHGGKRRVSACASLHHCHWDWRSRRICTVVFITRGGEWDSFRPNALNVQRQRFAHDRGRGPRSRHLKEEMPT